jgi:hypothetical protein
VTRLAALPLAETFRLQKSLSALHVQVPAVIVNAVGAGSCRRCRRNIRGEKRQLLQVVRSLGPNPRPILELAAPAVLPPPVGVAALVKWIHTWRSVPAATGR